ncbi:MAG TPA: DUF4333 domain-containing protein [Streptosporangiaceae bacterium]|jgi:hypothetical protein|nr:DUF4333 domain-containing protein [Streptosporangiaceae bacterium]
MIWLGDDRMLKGKGHVLAVVVMMAAGGWLVAGCSAHVSIGGSSTVPKHSVETEVATTLARQENQPVPNVVCPGDLNGKVGTVMYCSLTAQGATTVYPVKVQVDSISGTQVHFNIEVSQTPGHFTAPG